MLPKYLFDSSLDRWAESLNAKFLGAKSVGAESIGHVAPYAWVHPTKFL
jgi:hypothetical protein